jgi:hypothetical protein
MVEKIPDWQEMESLAKLHCSMHDCEHDLHCFRKKRPIRQSYRNGKCFECGADLIDWQRMDKINFQDANYLVQAIQYEMIRHIYWHKPLEERVITAARKKGLEQLKVDAEKRIIKSVSPPSKEIYPWDGTQTPYKGNLLYYAQHATATCCRKCAEEWYGIDRNRPLSDKEIKFMTDLIMFYIKKRLPDLPN